MSSVDQQVAVVRGWRPLAISTAPPPVGQQLDQSLKVDPRSRGCGGPKREGARLVGSGIWSLTF